MPPIRRFFESFAYFTLSNIFTLHLSSQFGLDDAAAGTLFGLRGAVSHVYGTVLGPVVDSVGLRRCLFVGFTLSAAGRFLFACAATTQTAALAVYVPMAMGHSLVGCSLTIGIKRVTLPTPVAGGTSSTWGFAMAYCAAVCGIALCGPTIDIATAVMAPAAPYRRLALITSAISGSAALMSAVAFQCAPSNLIEPIVSSGPDPGAGASQRLSRYCADLAQVGDRYVTITTAARRGTLVSLCIYTTAPTTTFMTMHTRVYMTTHTTVYTEALHWLAGLTHAS